MLEYWQIDILPAGGGENVNFTHTLDITKDQLDSVISILRICFICSLKIGSFSTTYLSNNGRIADLLPILFMENNAADLTYLAESSLTIYKRFARIFSPL